MCIIYVALIAVSVCTECACGFTQVTRTVSEQSEEGIEYWLMFYDDTPLGDDLDLTVKVVPPGDSAFRIARVLEAREEWLKSNGLPWDTYMDYKQRGMFLDAQMKAFQEEPMEKFLDDKNKEKGKNVKRMRRSRFNLEK